MQNKLTNSGPFRESTRKHSIYPHNIMAADKVLYKGHAVAAVAATSPHLAEEALALIQVEYEELPPVLTAEEAMKPSAPLLHDRLASLTNINIRPGGLLSDDDPIPGSDRKS